MTICHGPTDPHVVAVDLAAELIRGFAAVDALLQRQYASDRWRMPADVAAQLEASISERLISMILAFGCDTMNELIVLLSEAVDNLGRGEFLDPDDVLAFHAPVEVRSHGVVLSDPTELSPPVAAVEAELLRRGVRVLHEDEQDGRPVVCTASSVEQRSRDAVAELLPGTVVEWAGRAPRENRPAPSRAWRQKAPDQIRVWVRVGANQHIDEVVAAEDDEKIVVLAYTCSPADGSVGPMHEEPCRIALTKPVGERVVIDGFDGKELAREEPPIGACL